MRLSKKFREKIKLHALPAYKLADFGGVHHTVLSKWINGIERVKPDDPRVLRIAKFLGLKKSEIFDQE